MATVRARTFEYAVSLDPDWTATSDRGGQPLPHDGEAWTPEHLLLTGLARCTLTALRFHAARRKLELSCDADARGAVTRREEDGRFAFVEIEVNLRVTIEQPPEADVLRDLLARGEAAVCMGRQRRARGVRRPVPASRAPGRPLQRWSPARTHFPRSTLCGRDHVTAVTGTGRDSGRFRDRRERGSAVADSRSAGGRP